MKLIARLDRLLFGLLTAIAVVMLAVSVVINFVNIVGRYGFHAPIEWAEESMLYLMIGFVLLGGARIASQGSHIRMDVFLRLLPQSVRLCIQFCTEVLIMLTGFTLAWFSIPTVIQLYQFDQRSVAAEIPMFIPHALVPVGMITMAFLTLLRLVSGRWRDTSHSH
jgi:TRAP-type C4-dicarboxylate transport system permease small subunit